MLFAITHTSDLTHAGEIIRSLVVLTDPERLVWSNNEAREENMPHKHSGGCEHVHTHSDKEPIDVHTCHCSVCKRVTGQGTTHVAFFKHGDLAVDEPNGLKRQPFNDQNPNGPLELCTCATCGKPIMLDDKQSRIRAIVPNLMGFESKSMPAAYHAFYDPATGVPKPSDGRPVYEGLRPDFVWPQPS
jgi:hypothetical protein